MKICDICGHQNPDNVDKCRLCGNALGESQQLSAQNIAQGGFDQNAQPQQEYMHNHLHETETREYSPVKDFIVKYKKPIIVLLVMALYTRLYCSQSSGYAENHFKFTPKR